MNPPTQMPTNGAWDPAYTLDAVKCLSVYNPEKAVEIGLAIPDAENLSENRVNALTAAAKNWLNRDPLAASQWIASLNEGSVKDSVVSELAKNIAEKDRDLVSAMKWVNTIKSRDGRFKLLANIRRMEIACLV
jgi:hypothetical protein